MSSIDDILANRIHACPQIATLPKNWEALLKRDGKSFKRGVCEACKAPVIMMPYVPDAAKINCIECALKTPGPQILTVGSEAHYNTFPVKPPDVTQ